MSTQVEENSYVCFWYLHMNDHQNMVDGVFLIKKRNDKRVVVWHVNPIAWGSL